VITRIVISKQALADFKKQAIKDFPLEAFVTLWGKVDGSTVVITSVKDVTHRAKEDTIDYHEADALSPAAHTREHFIGSLHSHPNCSDSSPSETDWQDAFSHGEFIFGVMSINRKENGKFVTATSFWEPSPSISIIHPRLRKPKRPTPSISPTPQEGTAGEEILGGVVPSTLDPS